MQNGAFDWYVITGLWVTSDIVYFTVSRHNDQEMYHLSQVDDHQLKAEKCVAIRVSKTCLEHKARPVYLYVTEP